MKQTLVLVLFLAGPQAWAQAEPTPPAANAQQTPVGQELLRATASQLAVTTAPAAQPAATQNQPAQNGTSPDVVEHTFNPALPINRPTAVPVRRTPVPAPPPADGLYVTPGTPPSLRVE